MDPTVSDPTQKVMQQLRQQIADSPRELLEHLVERFRTLGNTAFRLKQYQGSCLLWHCSAYILAENLHPPMTFSSVCVCRSCEMLQSSNSCSRR